MHRTIKKYRHTVYLPILDGDGFMMDTLAVHSLPWYIHHGHVVIEDWRDAWTTRTLAPGCHMLCDDGWVSPVKSLDYAALRPYITVATGKWPLHPDTSPRGLLKSHVCGGRLAPPPVTNKRGHSHDQFLTMHVVARALLATNFDMERAAAIEPFHNRIMRNPVFRGILMTEALKWFNQAGVSPADMIQLLYERIKDPDVSISDLLKAQKLYFALHPDFAYEEGTGRNAKSNAQAALPPYLGAPVAVLDAADAEYTPPSTEQLTKEEPHDME